MRDRSPFRIKKQWLCRGATLSKTGREHVTMNLAELEKQHVSEIRVRHERQVYHGEVASLLWQFDQNDAACFIWVPLREISFLALPKLRKEFPAELLVRGPRETFP